MRMTIDDFIEKVVNVMSEDIKESENTMDSKDVLKIFNKDNFKSLSQIKPIELINGIIDLQNHIIVAIECKNRVCTLSNEERKELAEHIRVLKGWIDNIFDDAYTVAIASKSYKEMSKEELIEELKKAKGEK